MSVAEVRNLNKTYPAFALKRASFSIEAGRITGFITARSRYRCLRAHHMALVQWRVPKL